ncbi:MAG TPA: DinB family protein [Flavobacteriales bacterium]
MDTPTLSTSLLKDHAAFIALVRSLPKDRQALSINGKWTAVQHLDHIRLAVSPVSNALLLPKWFLRWRFGTPNRPPRTYEALVQRYREKLAAGGRASGRFIPPQLPAARVETLSKTLRRTVQKLVERMDLWEEQDLDNVLLPHPLLGKLTVREMLFFTLHHVQHHQALVERDHTHNSG